MSLSVAQESTPQESTPQESTPDHPSSRRRNRILQLTDPISPGTFSRMGWYLIGAIILLLLLPTLFLPLGPDQAIFMVIGEGILKGGVLYRDLVDIKPPLIFYLYAAAAALFGHGAVSIRIIDLLLQCLGCLMLIRLVRRASGSDLAAALSAVIYLVAYLAVGYVSLAQTESYLALIGGGALWLLLFRRKGSGFLLMGLLTAILFLFKFPQGIFLLVIVIGEMTLFEQKISTSLKHVGLIIVGFVLPIVAVTLYMQAIGSLGPFIEMQTFISGYAKREWTSFSLWLKNACTLLPYHLAVDYSTIFSVTALVGIVASMRSLSNVSAKEKTTIRLLRLCTGALVLLIISIMIEAKYLAWHITRFYPFAAILSAFGFVAAARWFALRRTFRREALYGRLLLLLFAISIFFYSPVSGYLWRTAAIGWKNLKREMGSTNLDKNLVQDEVLEEANRIAAYIVPRRRENEKLMVVSGMGGLIYHTCNYIPDYKLLHSAFVIAPFSPPSWREATRSYVLRERPRFIVLQYDDPLPALTGSSTTAIVAFRELEGLDSVLQTDYTQALRTASHDIFERRPLP